MNLKPLGDRVIVKQDEAEETTASGLFLATEAKENAPDAVPFWPWAEGKLDKDGNLVPVPVKVGDKVVYGKFGGTEINVEGEDVLILRGDDLYAVFA